jgi:hypothetical protein
MVYLQMDKEQKLMQEQKKVSEELLPIKRN